MALSPAYISDAGVCIDIFHAAENIHVNIRAGLPELPDQLLHFLPLGQLLVLSPAALLRKPAGAL